MSTTLVSRFASIGAVAVAKAVRSVEAANPRAVFSAAVLKQISYVETNQINTKASWVSSKADGTYSVVLRAGIRNMKINDLDALIARDLKHAVEILRFAIELSSEGLFDVQFAELKTKPRTAEQIAKGKATRAANKAASLAA